jgi:hypothetical protein
VPFDNPLTSGFMAAGDFSSGVPNRNCRLLEGGTADVLSFPVEFSPQRGLWFCDIHLNTSRVVSAFARLALARWQPKAISGSQVSPVVIADFMQIGADRWVSVKRMNSKQYSVTVSGVFRTVTIDPETTTEPKEHTISCSIEQRWHRLGKDMGWRPVGAGPPFTPKPVDGRNVGAWSATVTLPHSSDLVKFRLLLEENEWFDADASKTNAGTISKIRKSRTTYLHHIEL